MKQFLSLLLLFLPLYAVAESDVKGSKTNPVELQWSDLVPAGYEPEKILVKYEKEIKRLDELSEYSEEGFAIVKRIQAELDQAPANDKWEGKWIKLAGFIAPLEFKTDDVKRFLLVPYFGACIHAPPPPIYQTVYVEMTKGQSIHISKANSAFMITGKLILDRTETEIGNAAYHIIDARAELYKDPRWLE